MHAYERRVRRPDANRAKRHASERKHQSAHGEHSRDAIDGGWCALGGMRRGGRKKSVFWKRGGRARTEKERNPEGWLVTRMPHPTANHPPPPAQWPTPNAQVPKWPVTHTPHTPHTHPSSHRAGRYRQPAGRPGGNEQTGTCHPAPPARPGQLAASQHRTYPAGDPQVAGHKLGSDGVVFVVVAKARGLANLHHVGAGEAPDPVLLEQVPDVRACRRRRGSGGRASVATTQSTEPKKKKKKQKTMWWR